MEYIRLTPENLAQEHICCAISSAKDPQVISKKAWLAQRMQEGLTFLKADARGKCFIEYIPAENAWSPISAPNYMFIDCFWVSGSLKGHGYGGELFTECMSDSREKGMAGLCVVSSAKKKPFLSDPGFLKSVGFRTADTAAPFFELMYLPFNESSPIPQFLPQVKEPHCGGEGFTLYYSDGCPFTAKYVPQLEKTAQERGIKLSTVHFTSAQQVKQYPAVFANFTLFYNGSFVTHEILNEKKFLNICDKL